MQTESDYGPKPSILLRNRHVQTIFASAARVYPRPSFERRRLELRDGDFLDLDLLLNGSPKLAILSHGLEGSSRSRYVCALSTQLYKRGWDVLAWNYRGCGGEPNRLESLYHSGLSSDLESVIEYSLQALKPKAIALVGFSVGGNITLKYLGEREDKLPPQISAAVAISVPVNLKSCALQLERGFSRLYTFEFLRSLQAKIRAKRRCGSQIPDFSLRRITTFQHYDQEYTAPLHGFVDAEDYYRRSSSQQFIGGVRVPSLIINAQDDPFLQAPDELKQVVSQSRFVQLELPKFGAHNGFLSRFKDDVSWADARSMEFLENVLKIKS